MLGMVAFVMVGQWVVPVRLALLFAHVFVCLHELMPIAPQDPMEMPQQMSYEPVQSSTSGNVFRWATIIRL